MSSKDVVISVKNLSKQFEIYDRPVDRLKQFLLPRFQRLLGRAPKQYFKEFLALNDVSLEIKRGQTVGIIGRNGSGKSTLLHMICGTLTPTSGSIEITGRVAALLELGSGFNPEFSGRENVYMNAAVLGLSVDEVDERIDQILGFADIGDFIDQPVKTYSSGMMVRLAFAVISHVDADILIIDEALAVGDAFFTQKCMRFLRKFMETGTVLFVSHDTAAVINLCSKAIWLSHGVSKKEGAPKDVAQLYLADLYESNQGPSQVESVVQTKSVSEDFRDMRIDFINQTNLRNDIQIFAFKTDSAGFGKGSGQITLVQLLDNVGQNLSWVVGGEMATIKITCVAKERIFSPIIGFYLNDRLGQPIFGDNTYLTYFQSPVEILPGQVFSSYFEFRMPLLPVGDYSITAALAEGSQSNHVQHHWLHDALIFKSHTTSVSSGLVGVPMSNIKIEL